MSTALYIATTFATTFLVLSIVFTLWRSFQKLSTVLKYAQLTAITLCSLCIIIGIIILTRDYSPEVYSLVKNYWIQAWDEVWSFFNY